METRRDVQEVLSTVENETLGKVVSSRQAGLEALETITPSLSLVGPIFPAASIALTEKISPFIVFWSEETSPEKAEKVISIGKSAPAVCLVKMFPLLKVVLLPRFLLPIVTTGEAVAS